MKTLAGVVLILAIASATLAGPCGNLIFSANGATADVFNLDSLTKLGTLSARTVGSDNVTYSFQFAICGALSLPNGCPNSDDPSHSACWNPSTQQNNAAVCSTFPTQTHTPASPNPVNGYGTNCFGQYLTSGPNAYSTEALPDGMGVYLTYVGGDVQMEGSPPFGASVSIMCEKNRETPAIDVTWSPGMSSALFTIKHQSGCPQPQKVTRINRRLSGGSICLIILTVAIVVYIAAGICYNRFVKGREGLSMLPNHTFWTGFPGLLADGFRFIICRPPVGNTSYERVEG